MHAQLTLKVTAFGYRNNGCPRQNDRGSIQGGSLTLGFETVCFLQFCPRFHKLSFGHFDAIPLISKHAINWGG